MKSIKKIGFFYFHVASNIGDLAINEGVSEIVKLKYPNASIECFILDGQQSLHLKSSISSGVNYHYINGKELDFLKYAIEPSIFWSDFIGDLSLDLVLINSGEHYFQYLHNENSYSLFWRLLPALSAIEKGLPVCFLPSTVGPLETLESRALLKSFFSVCAKVFIRDSVSHEYLNSIAIQQGPGSLNAFLALDPAFFLESSNDNSLESDFPFPTSNNVAIVVRLEDWGIRIKDSERKKKNKLHVDEGFVNSLSFCFASCLIDRILSETNKNIIVFNQTLADKKLSKSIFEKYIHTGRVFHYQPTSVQDYLAKLDLVDEVIASRFHALILGMVMKKFPHGVYFLNHGKKMPGLFSLLGLDLYCHEINDKNLAEVVDCVFEALVRDKKSTQIELLKKISSMKADFFDKFDFVLDGDSFDKEAFQYFKIRMIETACDLHLQANNSDAEKFSVNLLGNDQNINASLYDSCKRYQCLVSYLSYNFKGSGLIDNNLKNALFDEIFCAHPERAIGLDFSLPETRNKG
ncbi:polysaccharide pyruvyl transferase family protein [Vreelandella hamiltonii]|uniref:Polysaccharide pyruvyl transferase domain-containing protein n=1 Tax=Vreelandella hamiltonii TaxID=502829 RepID=A0A8H9I663_9GAMM|nr:polysaccharide pyruvyl transferase family protein [Halomonas hamiltonii]GGW41907.1 hypothetical protein GCM10007157_35330 [Halomonas hamiltonii]